MHHFGERCIWHSAEKRAPWQRRAIGVVVWQLQDVTALMTAGHLSPIQVVAPAKPQMTAALTAAAVYVPRLTRHTGVVSLYRVIDSTGKPFHWVSYDDCMAFSHARDRIQRYGGQSGTQAQVVTHGSLQWLEDTTAGTRITEYCPAHRPQSSTRWKPCNCSPPTSECFNAGTVRGHMLASLYTTECCKQKEHQLNL